MMLKEIKINWQNSECFVEIDTDVIFLKGVQSSNVLNSAPWGKSSFIKELRVLKGDDVSVLVLFMESRDVLTFVAEDIVLPAKFAHGFPADA